MSSSHDDVATREEAPQEPIAQTIEEVLETVDEKFEVEAIAQMIEQLDIGDQLNKRLQMAFRSLRQSVAMQRSQLGAAQGILRELMLDMALVKRALASMGQIGVAQRSRIEKELILEVFPPGQVQNGTGISIARASGKTATVEDCEDRRALCKSACCRIFSVPLSAQEVLRGSFDWNPRTPYTLVKNKKGCVHLRDEEGYRCEKYRCRPSVCSSYSCVNDKRIWSSFEKRVLNPDLAKRLASLDPSANDKSCSESVGYPQKPQRDSSASVAPPDFSTIRDMIVPEPENKFVPPPAEESDEATPVSCSDETEVQTGNGEPEVAD